ncbi:SPL family radical SAM protein [Turneriella parva]|nr:radical SAM protein [Turneriella parva]
MTTSASMQIDTLYLEKGARDYAAAARIVEKLNPQKIEEIEDYQTIFSKRRTPYLSKRDTRNVFVAVKRGALVKEAPAAYGYGSDDLHYYYIHAYNCVYECEYCYLQGYFSSPDLVLFVNHDEIIRDMRAIAAASAAQRVWFHAGEFSDSLALSHITAELADYWQFFSETPNAYLELRTKSINLTAMRQLKPINNAVVSFSLSTHTQAARHDRDAPTASQRLAAMQRLKELGFRLGVHFDPLIYAPDFGSNFEAIVCDLSERVGFAGIDYISLGVVRFAKDVYREAKENYPASDIFARNFIQGTDHKMRYVRPLRLQMLELGREILKKHGCPEDKIYFCME